MKSLTFSFNNTHKIQQVIEPQGNDVDTDYTFDTDADGGYDTDAGEE